MLDDSGGLCLPFTKGTNINVTSILETAPVKILDFNSSDDDNKVIRSKKRLQYFSESDSTHDQSVDKDTKRILATIESDSDTPNHSQKYELSRTEHKRKNLKDKFKNLKTPRGQKSSLRVSDLETNIQILDKDDSQSSDQEISCLKVKKKVKKKKLTTISSVCDSDTSDEDVAYNSNILRKKSKPKESTSPKQVRMSTKEAMENMQKIKSESNRMLREKDVSLPYHRPKALSLQDIMNRRRPALTNDGKALPIKMNNEQLQQYVKLLEERQKEMIELCKSDTEEEDTSEIELNKELNNAATTTHSDNNAQQVVIKNNTDNIENSNMTSSPINDMVSPLETEETLDNHSNIHTNDEIEHNINMVAVTEPPPQNLSTIYSDNNDNQRVLLHMELENGETHNDIKSNMNMVKNLNVVEVEVNDVIKTTPDVFNGLSDDEFNIENIDKIIEEAEIINDTLQNVANKYDSTIERTQINIKPILTGSPGMFINLENECSLGLQKSNGIELLKERFEYFAKLKSVEELEKNRETKYKPGTQHLKLKYELEEQIAEQRSLEWEKRLEQEKLQKADIENNLSDEDEIDKIEAILEEKEIQIENNESENSEEELEENDIDMTDKPMRHNPMIDNEAEESEEEDGLEKANGVESIIDDSVADADSEDCSDNDKSSDDSTESDNEVQPKEKKGRILKAFEDSDDETSNTDKQISSTESKTSAEVVAPTVHKDEDTLKSQDEDLQLAQLNKSLSEDIFATQDSEVPKNACDKNPGNAFLTSPDLGSQTFSILNVTTNNDKTNLDLSSSEKVSITSKTQSINDDNFDLVTKMCGSFSQSFVDPECPQSQLPPSQQIGDDIAALCTGKFYDNPFVSDSEENSATTEMNSNNFINSNRAASTENVDNNHTEQIAEIAESELVNNIKAKESSDFLKGNKTDDGTILKSILDELDEPDFKNQKHNRYFISNDNEGIQNTQLKKKFVIDSDDELDPESTNVKLKPKLKKRKPEKRALKISDDEDESEKELDESDSEIEEDPEAIVEYDSEENEIEVKTKSSRGKKIGEFFENEAEMTSEDEWVGSGDEDEAGLDRMEREAGDDDVFQQAALQRELGQIHMREVLDQDKRDVRLLQELLFEDGDLGDGHRQRKFRWRTDADGDEEAARGADDMTETQEEEFESEEQWRKQRHERELFLRQMQEKSEDEVLNTSISRTTIIKANLSSRTMSSLLSEAKSPAAEKDLPGTTEKKTVKDILSPKKPFALFQQSSHGSLLARGRGALARLAALATPLAADDDAPKLTASASSRNFVFAARAPADLEPKVSKRKAENNVSTPKLIKKMKTEETQKYLKNSLFDHFKS